jgi:hypothetical protein
MPPLSSGSIRRIQPMQPFAAIRKSFTRGLVGISFLLLFVPFSFVLPAQGEGSLPRVLRDHLTISGALPGATVGRAYDGVVSVSGGARPYQVAIVNGTLPPGLSLDARLGTISGTPVAAGMYTFRVFATDLPRADRGERRFTIVVANSSGSSASSAAGVVVSISPVAPTLSSGSQQQFTAAVRETSNVAVTWSAGLGTISVSGLFTAPAVTVQTSLTVTATSVADSSKKASTTVSVTPISAPPPPPPTPPPPTPAPGPTGADNRYCGSGDVANFGGSDGPATLPQRCINTALVNTPSTGKSTLVPAGGNPNTALSNASCGDTILLQAGASFQGPVVLPAKNCDANHWITLRTSALDSSLPAEGTRLTPCYAGVAWLPARPGYSCPSPNNVLPKIHIANGAGAVTVSSGANYYRLLGLEITRDVGTGVSYALVKMGAADHLIFDRVWIHGTPGDETARGIGLADSTNVAVIDSYFNDFQCIASTGTCTDAQAIIGGNSFVPTGSYKIVNNFLESAAENILFGGAGGSTVPADIEVRRNHMFKPMTWMPGSPNFIGKSFVAKNLFELKNAARLLFEGNVMENSWGGFSQVGWGIVLTPRGSWAAVEDITIRYNTIAHVGSGFQIAATQATLSNGTKVDSMAMGRISIHDVIVDDMNAAAYNGSGIGFQIGSGFTINPPLNNLTINHVTMLNDPNTTFLIVGANLINPARPSNISLINNIAIAGRYSVWSTGVAATACATSGQPTATFNQCWASYLVNDNALIAYPSGQGSWPTGNYTPGTAGAVGFANFNNGVGGNYQLLPSSPYKSAGSDGKDLGADVSTVNSATAGVY